VWWKNPIRSVCKQLRGTKTLAFWKNNGLPGLGMPLRIFALRDKVISFFADYAALPQHRPQPRLKVVFWQQDAVFNKGTTPVGSA
jgi:hypothetical protein